MLMNLTPGAEEVVEVNGGPAALDKLQVDEFDFVTSTKNDH
jgi:hypothetical protein